MISRFTLNCAVFARTSLCLAALALGVAACGGGGSDAGTPPFASDGPGVSPFPPDDGNGGSIGASSQYAGVLTNSAPGAGAQASDWSATSCTSERQRYWVRADLNEDYLFYDALPSIDPLAYVGPTDVFYQMTRVSLASRDRFSFVIAQSEADATFQAGTATGTGASFAYDGQNRLRVAYVETGSPADGQLVRGAQIVSIDGTPVGSELTDVQSAALYPEAAGGTIALGVKTTPADATTATVSLTNAVYTLHPVHRSDLLPDGVGYLHYTDFSSPAGELQLADAIAAFADQGVSDLVLDLRYNGGGYLAISSQLGYMLAGAGRTADKTFETLVHNRKRRDDDVAYPFFDEVIGFAGTEREGEALPSLNLSRVFVLVSGNTCSASESLISGLRGIGLEVVLIGRTTCGKPYGFTQENNCTLAYFPLEFEGRNHLGQTFPASGITPTCTVADDFDRALGSTTEGMLAAALAYRSTGSCTVASEQSLQSERPHAGKIEARSPLREIKLLRR
ncbi:S41 family peptidase [Schlegelella sp. S2-27]|uniref:S41 family peptidase n=1 Tax=Caldimonas mangrovi TaxID=2944811 RepID=A0ABT0YIX2_9BURK|nr:S41 family peptidase [Caldimonas mangrovi]MCM5678681.1 S41 family peptidase [Caldimonas mangrovi]